MTQIKSDAVIDIETLVSVTHKLNNNTSIKIKTIDVPYTYGDVTSYTEYEDVNLEDCLRDLSVSLRYEDKMYGLALKQERFLASIVNVQKSDIYRNYSNYQWSSYWIFDRHNDFKIVGLNKLNALIYAESILFCYSGTDFGGSDAGYMLVSLNKKVTDNINEYRKESVEWQEFSDLFKE